MLLPPLQVEGDVGHHVDGGFKNKERPIPAQMVKTVPREAPFHIEPESLTETVGAAFVSMAGNTLFVRTNEYCVMILCVLVQQTRPDKMTEHLRGDLSVLHQIGEHPAGVLVCRRQGEGRPRLLYPFFGSGVNDPTAPQQESHRAG